MVTLQKSMDAEALQELQKRSFGALLAKYLDYETNPAMESLEALRRKLAEPGREYYLIKEGESIAGFACIKQAENSLWVTPIGLLPEHQGRGLGKEAMRALEALYANASIWELMTIAEEPNLCRFYEKLGYSRTGKTSVVKPGMNLVHYSKHTCKSAKKSISKHERMKSNADL